MPRHEEAIGRYNNGFVVEYMVTEETHWVQMSGTWMVRCDHDAKETGSGLWSLFDSKSGSSSSWKGRMGGWKVKINPDLWIKDDHTRKYVSEKDYS
tara:strand:+ start:1020 stop:1307 length:288 start_codon:yes stop_codon:yes gene_type:complete